MRTRFISLLLCCFLPQVVHAQNNAGGGTGGPAGVQAPKVPKISAVGGMGGAPSRAKVLAAIQEQLAVSAEDWERMLPLVERVLDAKHGLSSGAGTQWTMQNGQKAEMKISTSTVDTPVGQAMQAVRDAVADENASPDEITEKLAALQAAREQARTEYAEAQDALREVLTPRQRAVLTTMGTIE